MSIVEDVNAAIVQAMRDREAGRLSALRMLKSALTNKAVEKGHALDDVEARQVVTSLVKQRKDSAEQFTAGARPELAAKETAEIAILETYLPPAPEAAAVELAVREAIAETRAVSPKDMGRVMKAVMARLAGQSVDGRAVNDLVRKLLDEAGRAKGVE